MPNPRHREGASPLLTQLTLGTRWTFVGGKGGVGKTTTAAALAVALADSGEDVLVLSTDPAHSLGDALGLQLGPDPAPVPAVPRLHAFEIDADLERRRFLETRRGALLEILERGTYLDSEDVREIVDLVTPGLDEVAALLRLTDLASTASGRVIVDTAPTGHTLRLLELPELAREWVRALDAMEARHRAVSTALAGRYTPDEAAVVLEDLEAELGAFADSLRDPDETRFVLVTTREPIVLEETRRYQEELAERGIAPGGLIVNRAVPPQGEEAGRGMVFVPPLRAEPVGVDGLRRFSAAAGDEAPEGGTPVGERRPVVGDPFEPPSDRRIYLVGGKGGVGKSTTAVALAIQLAEAGRRVLLFSTDPAGSLGDVLETEVGPRARPVSGLEALHVRQVDADEAWARFRQDYRDDVQRLFGSLTSGGFSAGADQEVVERLVDLAPPGIDELVALLEVIDLTEDEAYDALVLDTAPTGHLLRWLELPELADQWVKMVMRLLLKYREVIGLGELAARAVELSRDLRRLRELLADASRAWVLIVALPEALSVPETKRLLDRLGELGVPAGALLLNQVLTPGGEPREEALAPAARLIEQTAVSVAGAPRLESGPRGLEALRAFSAAWRRLSLAS